MSLKKFPEELYNLIPKINDEDQDRISHLYFGIISRVCSLSKNIILLFENNEFEGIPILSMSLLESGVDLNCFHQYYDSYSGFLFYKSTENSLKIYSNKIEKNPMVDDLMDRILDEEELKYFGSLDEQNKLSNKNYKSLNIEEKIKMISPNFMTKIYDELYPYMTREIHSDLFQIFSNHIVPLMSSHRDRKKSLYHPTISYIQLVGGVLENSFNLFIERFNERLDIAQGKHVFDAKLLYFKELDKLKE